MRTTTRSTRDMLADYIATGDCYQRSAALILTCRLFTRAGVLDTRIARHVGEGEMWFERILDDGTWSSGERVLLEWAWAMWSGHALDPTDLCYIDRELQQLALQALAIRLAVTA